MSHENTIKELQFIVNVMEARKKDIIEMSNNKDNFTSEMQNQFAARAMELDRWKKALEKVIACSGIDL